MTDADELVRRFLRQRVELGGGELFLERLTPQDLDRLLAAATTPRPSPAAESPSPYAGRRSTPADPPQATSRAPLSEERLLQLRDLEAVRAEALGCPRCRLCETRGHVVFGEGSATADLLVVDGTPSTEDDLSGRPLTGEVGEMLDLLLASVGFSRESVYITGAIKCRPPGDRAPEPEEAEACSPFLRRQIEIVRPGAILALGGVAARTLLGEEAPMAQLRGEVHEFLGVPLVTTYHPAALLRNPAWVRPVWEDLQRLRVLLDAR